MTRHRLSAPQQHRGGARPGVQLPPRVGGGDTGTGTRAKTSTSNRLSWLSVSRTTILHGMVPTRSSTWFVGC
jgi:hypothetical protein